jgi:hypothetical protein
VDGAADARVSAASANVSAHGFVNVVVGGLGIFLQEHSGAHDLTGLAIAALGNVDFNPRALKRMGKIRGKTFDGRNLFAFNPGKWCDARANGFAVEVDGAGSAEGHAASEFGAGKAKGISNDPEERGCRILVNGNGYSIQGEGSHDVPPTKTLADGVFSKYDAADELKVTRRVGKKLALC